MDDKPMDSKHSDGCSFASQRSDLASYKWGGGVDEGTAVTTRTLGLRLASVSFNMDV